MRAVSSLENFIMPGRRGRREEGILNLSERATGADLRVMRAGFVALFLGLALVKMLMELMV